MYASINGMYSYLIVYSQAWYPFPVPRLINSSHMSHMILYSQSSKCIYVACCAFVTRNRSGIFLFLDIHIHFLAHKLAPFNIVDYPNSTTVTIPELASLHVHSCAMWSVFGLALSFFIGIEGFQLMYIHRVRYPFTGEFTQGIPRIADTSCPVSEYIGSQMFFLLSSTWTFFELHRALSI